VFKNRSEREREFKFIQNIQNYLLFFLNIYKKYFYLKEHFHNFGKLKKQSEYLKYFFDMPYLFELFLIFEFEKRKKNN